MKDKKGFTLIEVLAVIVILAVIAGLIIPNIKRYKDKGNKEYYDKLKDNVILAAKDYYSNHPEELPRGQVAYVDGVEVRLYTTELSLQNLINNNYLTNEVVDTQGESCVKAESKVVVTNMNDVYTYHVCYFCNGKLDSDNSDEVCKYSNPQNSYCAIKAESVSGNAFKKELVVTKFGDTSAEIVPEGVLKNDDDGKYYVEESGTYTFYLKDTKGNILDTCSYTLYIKDDTAPTCEIVKNGPSLDINVSDNYRLASVKSDINNSSKSYACKSKDATMDLPISTKDTIQTKIDISNITTDITYTATVTDCSGNSHVCTKPLTPSSGGDSGDEPEICTNGETATDKLVGFTKCDATCVNGSWQCNEESSCTEGDSFTEDIPCNSCANNCKTTRNTWECVDGKYKKTNSTNIDCGSSSNTCTPYTTPCDCSACKYKYTCDSNGNLKKGKCITCEINGCTGAEVLDPCPGVDLDNAGKRCTTSTVVNGEWTIAENAKGTCLILKCVQTSGCFTLGTKVLTPTGYKNIEYLHLGDKVMSYNTETKQMEVDVVSNTFIFNDLVQQIYDISTSNGMFTVSKQHKFYVKVNEKLVLKTAGELNVGDILVNDKNEEIKITSINSYTSSIPVYNIEVLKNHNYYVTENNILTHNMSLQYGFNILASGSSSSKN